MAQTHTFKKGEEIANAVSHGIGFLISIAILVLLIVFSSLHGSTMHVLTFTIFGSTMAILYISSTMLHALPSGKAKYVFEILDHSSIYLFIAGTYTPITLIVVKGLLGWSIFGIIWGMAIGGIVFKSFFVRKYLFTSTILYVVMGWLIVFVWDSLVSSIAREGIILLVAGGIFYTVGSIFYIWRMFPYHHMVWHLFVMAGSILHFFMVLFYILPITV
ncbi:hemolysin III family protein [bacterium LRH843]|nr:hemolysin III family protein [bacterium LRH843]